MIKNLFSTYPVLSVIVTIAIIGLIVYLVKKSKNGAGAIDPPANPNSGSNVVGKRLPAIRIANGTDPSGKLAANGSGAAQAKVTSHIKNI